MDGRIGIFIFPIMLRHCRLPLFYRLAAGHETSRQDVSFVVFPGSLFHVAIRPWMEEVTGG